MEGHDVSLLPALVREHGVNLVVLGDAVRHAGGGRAGRRGLRRRRRAAGRHHTVRRPLSDPPASGGPVAACRGGPRCALTMRMTEAAVHCAVARGRCSPPGNMPTADESPGSTLRGTDGQVVEPLTRRLLKRCLVWAQGYALAAEFPRSVVLFMDDFGTSDRTYLSYWHYRTLDENDIRHGLIEPLQRHHAVLSQNVVSGYVDRKGRRIANPWRQRVVDESRRPHDPRLCVGETGPRRRFAGRRVRDPVSRLHAHAARSRLAAGTLLDLAAGRPADHGFDVEFEDRLRGREVPAATQVFLMKRALECLRADFAVRPLFVVCGGFSKYSKSYPNNSPRLAAELGFGLAYFAAPCYSGAGPRRAAGVDRAHDVLGLRSPARSRASAVDRRRAAVAVPARPRRVAGPGCAGTAAYAAGHGDPLRVA